VRKNYTLFIMFIFGLFILSITVLPNSAMIWAQEAKLVPMELDGTEWEVTMVYVTKKGKKKSSEDKLIFSNNKFISESFEKKKYEPTNYSMTLEDDGTTKFGTMQKKGKDTSFWKGTIKGDTIDGSVHTQFSGGSSTRTTYFNGILISGVLLPKGEKLPPPPAPVVDPVTAKEVEAEKIEKIVENAVEKAQQPVIAVPTESE